jgi:RNA polymerase sigma factor (sigma-70 family)
MDDDHTLLSRFAKAKDETAFIELVRRHLDLVCGVCLRRTGSRPLAEELARKAGSLKPEVLVVGWLHRAAHLESLSAFRSESSRLRKMKNYMDHLSDFDPEPDRFREISPFLDQALDALPPSDRDVVLLRFASDLTLQQIGRKLGKSESAAQRHLQRVLEKLAVYISTRPPASATARDSASGAATSASLHAQDSKSKEEDKISANDRLSSIPGLDLTAEQNALVEAAQVNRKATEQDAITAWQSRFTKNRTDVMELVLAGHGVMLADLVAAGANESNPVF